MHCHIRILAGSLKATAGSQIYNRELIRRLAVRGHHVSVICFDDGSDEYHPEDWSGIELTCLPSRNWSSIPAAWRLSTNFQGMQARRDIATAQLSEPDVVIAMEHLFLKRHAQRFPATPWLYLPHSLVIGPEIDSYGLTGIHHRLVRQFYVDQQTWALRNATAVVRFNQFAVDALRDFYSAETMLAPILINPTGVDAPLADRHQSSDGQRSIVKLLSVGRLVSSKNLDFVLHCLAVHRGRDWTLDVVGDGPESDNIQKLIQRLQLTSHVTLHGHQPDPAQWYENADVLLFPSKLENMPLVLLESMAHGTPALVIRGDGHRYRVPFSEVVTDNVNGFLAHDEDDFAKRLTGILTGCNELPVISENARQYVQQHYSWESHLNRLEACIEDLLTRRPGLHRKACLEIV